MTDVELTSMQMDRDEAMGWIVVCVDMEEPINVVYGTGVFNSPEEALVEAGRQAENSKRLHDTDDAGWKHSVVPLYPPGT